MKLSYLTLSVLTASLLSAADTAEQRLKDSAEILKEIMAIPDKGIPQDLLEKAHCIVIVPEVQQVAFVVGGKFGKGFAVCRREHDGWGAPGAVRVEGGSVGFQIGASSTDLVMLVMNEHGMRRLLEDKFTVEAQASVAAGPVGRNTSALTDAQLSADVLSWSRSRGLFAGIALEGATLRNDLDANRELYRKPLSNNEILNRFPDFQEQYARAKDIQCEILAAETKEVADAPRVGKKIKTNLAPLPHHLLCCTEGGRRQDRDGLSAAQNADALVRLRNEIVHYHTGFRAHPDPEPKTIERRLKGKFQSCAYYKTHAGLPLFPHRCLGAGCAVWAVKSARAFADEFHTKLGLAGVYQSFLNIPELFP